jgi:hypothetical protein
MKISLVFAIFLASSISVQANNILTLSPDATVVNVGDTLSLDVILDATDPVFGYQFDLNYPTFLSFLSATEEGDFFTDGLGFGTGIPIYDTPDDAAGIVTNVLDSLIAGSPFTSPGTVVNFQFTVVGVGMGSFSTANELLTDGSGNPSLEIDPVAAVSITSATAPSVPEPSTTGLALFGAAFIYRRFRTRKTIAQ